MAETIKVLVSEEEVNERIKTLGKQISENYAGKQIHMICVLKGGVFFMCELAKRISVPVSLDFMCVSSYGDATTSSGVVRIAKDLDESIEGKDVLIVEDIIDSGRTLYYLIDVLKKRNPKSIQLCTLLDKPERRERDVKVDYVGFEIPDEFVVGYGLDYAQKYRNLPYIGVVEGVEWEGAVSLNDKKYKGISGATVVVFIAVIFFVLWMTSRVQMRGQEITFTQFEQEIKDDNVTEVVINQNKAVPTGVVTLTLRDSRETGRVNVSDVNETQKLLDKNDVEYRISAIPQDSVLSTTVLPVVLMLVGFMFITMMMNRQSGGANAKAMNFGKSRARMSSENDKKVTFADVAGLQEEKEELAEIVDFLKSPKKYVQVGARIPKGVLLEGPPGTGKTLLAKAVAGEAGVPFFTISGSDFVEMFVGVGASRVRDLFQDAKKNAPCIIFIDEIDAVARRRGSGLGGGHDEREQTLNQMLVEMDGFGVNEGIIVMAATNRKDILDPAILRPGRFDRNVVVGRPDVKGREEILKVHARNKPLGDDVDLKQIAQTTSGFTGADLENLLNEAAILAAKENRVYIQQSDIRHAFVKVGIGPEKKSRVVSEKERRITAYHEAGHAILFHVLPDVGPVYSVSIVPTGGAGGYTMPLPEGDDMFNTKGHMLQEITVSLGGRVAEEQIFDDITTGASQDIRQATAIAKSMITKFGMSERLGLINYDNDSDEVFIGRDFGHTSRGYGEKVAGTIDEEVKRIIDECYLKAKAILEEHQSVLEACAQLLLEKEKITRSEFEALFEK